LKNEERSDQKRNTELLTLLDENSARTLKELVKVKLEALNDKSTVSDRLHTMGKIKKKNQMDST